MYDLRVLINSLTKKSLNGFCSLSYLLGLSALRTPTFSITLPSTVDTRSLRNPYCTAHILVKYAFSHTRVDVRRFGSRRPGLDGLS